MEVKEITEHEMNSSPRKIRNTSSPTGRLRNELKKHEHVLEKVGNSIDSSPDDCKIFKCNLENGSIKRKKYRGLKKNRYSWKDYYQRRTIVKLMDSQGFHEHNSGRVHEILTLDSDTKWDTLVELVGNDRRSLREKFVKKYDNKGIPEAFQVLIDFYVPRVEEDIWDIEIEELTRKSHISRSSLLKDLFRVIKYAKKNEMTVDNALTALELEDNPIYEDLKEHTTNESEEKRLNLYRRAKKEFVH